MCKKYGANTITDDLRDLFKQMKYGEFDQRFGFFISFLKRLDEYICEELEILIDSFESYKNQSYEAKIENKLNEDLIPFDIINELYDYLNKIKTTTDKNQLIELYGDLYRRLRDFNEMIGLIRTQDTDIMNIIEMLQYKLDSDEQLFIQVLAYYA